MTAEASPETNILISSKNLFESLSKAQGEIDAATKSAENAAFKKDGKNSRYADIAEVIDVIREPAMKHGLAVFFDFETNYAQPAIDMIRYRLVHSSGESFTSKWLMMRMRGHTAHDFGAASTYYRRQLLKAIYQIPEEDDDGNTASGKKDGDPNAKPDPKPEAPKGNPTEGNGPKPFAQIAKSKPMQNSSAKGSVSTASPSKPQDKGPDPADFAMPMGAAGVKGQPLKKLSETKLKEIYNWAAGEMEKDPAPKNIEQIFAVRANVGAFLVTMGVQL